LRQGRQAFVVCPLIDESDRLGVRSVTVEYERLRSEVFAEFEVEMLHGRLPARDKEARMARFAAGEAQLLVSTSVVEVGVDISNATVMLIEAAERFGLAQLHQFRGRVGRGEHRSYCLLFAGETAGEALGRLEVVAGCSDGFEIAEKDLRLRGPGDVVGLRQHGLPELHVGDLLDPNMMARAGQAAAQWLLSDPHLQTYPPLTEAMQRYKAVFDLD
jgi:ATP-dependent DNA helicase RecG